MMYGNYLFFIAVTYGHLRARLEGGGDLHKTLKIMHESQEHLRNKTGRSTLESRAKAEEGQSMCMLTLAHQPDFIFLAARLKLQARFEQGIPPPIVVVFDTPEDHHEFCRRYDQCNDKSFQPLALSALLGQSIYDQIHHQSIYDQIKYKNRCYDNRITFGRNYQALKKFYGMLNGPTACETYFVSDCESLPFRPYDFKRSFQRVSGYHVLSSWYSMQGCLYRTNTHDAKCSTIVAEQLRFDRAWRGHGGTIFDGGRWDPEYPERFIEVDQFWSYNRKTVEDFIGLVEKTSALPFAFQWQRWGWGDQAFHNLMSLYFAGFTNSTQKIRNMPDEFQRAFPEASNACCRCDKNNGHPCYYIRDLWSKCVMGILTPSQIATFITEDLGIFGHWFEMGDIPTSILNASSGISWCVNNCFNQHFLSRLSEIEGVNTAAMLEDPIVKAAFERCQGVHCGR